MTPAKLRALVAKMNNSVNADGEWRTKVELLNALPALLDRLDAAEMDAARYRLSRDYPWPDELRTIIIRHQNTLWDAAIDAARGKGEAMTTPPRQPTREMTNKNDSAPLSHVTPAEPPATDARSNDDEVICPNCIHQFRAVPVNVQDQLQRQAREIADWKRKYGDANEWGLRNAAAWKERAERAEAERDVWKDKAETRGREGCEARAERDALRADAERYRKVRDLMTHEHSGPHVGWTLGVLLSGDDPDAAIDAAREKVR